MSKSFNNSISMKIYNKYNLRIYDAQTVIIYTIKLYFYLNINNIQIIIYLPISPKIKTLNQMGNCNS